MKKRGQVWLLLVTLLLALGLKLAWPAGAAALRREGARALAADAELLTLVEALGRSLAEEPLVETLRALSGERGA